MPDPDLGERICIYVVGRAGSEIELSDTRAALTARGVAAYKLPERLVLVHELPQTKVGKIDKKALREDIAARLQSDRTTTH